MGTVPFEGRPEDVERTLIVLKSVIAEGFRLDGSWPSAVGEAAKRLNLSDSAIRHRIRTLTEMGRWPPQDVVPLPQPEPIPEPPPPVPPADPVDLRRLKDENARLKRELDEAHREVIKAQDFRASLLGLTQDMPEPVIFDAPSSPSGLAETIILCANDWQWGEVVSLEKMDGLNSYNPAIARNRAERLFQGAVDLATNHWAGPPPARLMLILGGDMISGEIHEELAKTNELKAISAMKDCASALMGGIDLILRSLDCPIDVIVIPGNHGRTTRKPESKLYAEESYDTLLGSILEMHYAREKRVTFFLPASGDAVFTIDGRTFLVTHGDRIGSRGGQGHVGPAATIGRGFKKLIADYQARGILIDEIIIGHFHCDMKLEEGNASGTLVGYSEYARDHRMRAKPASQLFMAVHPTRGITQRREIFVGSPEEGSLYNLRRTAQDRPRYRVRAISA